MRAAGDDLESVADHALHQPYLHDLVTAVYAPGVALSAHDGQIRSGVDGAFWSDRRLLSKLAVRVAGVEPAAVSASTVAPGQVRFLGVLRNLGDRGADPTVTVQRDRTVVESGLIETVTVASAARSPVTALLEIDVACDLADMASVKSGQPHLPLSSRLESGDVVWDGPDGAVVRLSVEPQSDSICSNTLSWRVVLHRGERFCVTVRATIAGASPSVVRSASGGIAPAGFAMHSDDHRLARLVEQSVADLGSLCLCDPLDTSDRFLAAGAPWFLTLFGRDALWAARMLLPLGTEIAAGTLRTLGRRQGTVVDTATAQEPGKIMHEIRPTSTAHIGDDLRLPPLYYGTVDATALWVSLLHDAWRWGMPTAEVAALLPAAGRAMEWIIGHGAGANDFVSYRDASGHGLANQGWKDSGDSVQYRDGTLAKPPIALCEVQGYAYAAARQAADLFEAFGVAGSQLWRPWSDALAERFRREFWVDDPDGPYPAIALDAAGHRVDAMTSNIGHLLGTGLLDAAEERHVITRLGRPDMDSGFGLRTMSSIAAGFNPLAYHGGSVWTHDTAIALTGLAASHDPAAAPVAASLAVGLLAAAPSFDFRLPELFGGHASADFPTAVPYPAACGPQAWSAASAIAILTALLGLRADVPAGVLQVRPMQPSPVGAIDVAGLRLGTTAFDIAIDSAGDPMVRGLRPGTRVIVG